MASLSLLIQRHTALLHVGEEKNGKLIARVSIVCQFTISVSEVFREMISRP